MIETECRVCGDFLLAESENDCVCSACVIAMVWDLSDLEVYP